MWGFFRTKFSERAIPTLQALAGASVGAFIVYEPVHASGNVLHPQHYPWSHKGNLDTLDHASIRRGFQVYKEVCSSCHALRYIAFRNFVNTIFTEEQAKSLAASYDIKDGPDETGEMFERPGKLSDYLPHPYPNEEAARAANGGALPPDLSLIIKARPNGEDYVFSLLTGYRDAPAGISLREGLYYNPYFAGGAIGMPQPLFDGMVEYEDGTPATQSQHAKDVTTFLVWTSSPEFDSRKLFGFQSLVGLSVAFLTAIYWKRFRWSVIKNRRVTIKRSLR